MSIKNIKDVFLILFVLIIAISLRLYNLGIVPMGVTHDELLYIYNAYSIIKTGKDVVGQFLPIIVNLGMPFLPVPIYLMAPIVGLLPLSLFSGRFLNFSLGILEVIAVYLISYILFKKKNVSLLASLSLAISPWHLQLTRTAYDTVVAIFFYLYSFLLFYLSVKNFNNIKKTILFITLFLISLFLALFSYRATNIIFIPVFFSIIWYFYPLFKNNKKFIAAIFFGLIVILIAYASINLSQRTNYTREVTDSEYSPLNFSRANTIINDEITKSEAPLFISRIFINKVTYGMRMFRENYMGAFSTDFLFTKGEAESLYSLWWRGLLYLIDLPFLILGLIFLYKTNKRALAFVIVSILIAPLPSGIAGPTYVSRAFYMIPYISILIGGGVYSYILFIKKYKIFTRFLLISLLILVYLAQVSSYLHQYYTRYAIYSADSWFNSTKELSLYLGKHPGNNIIVANTIFNELLNYAFYNKIDPNEVQISYANSKNKREFSINNIKFTDRCLNNGDGDPKSFLPKNSIYIAHPTCHIGILANEYIRRYNGRFIDTGDKIWNIYKSKDLQ